MQTFTHNAIAWAAFKLQGGLKNILLTAGGYAAVLAVGVLLRVQFATIPLSVVMHNLLMVLLAFQAGLLLLFAPSRIQQSVRRDVTSGMIESHRLMPLSPTRAVLGYLLGPSIQPLALSAATFLVGCVLAHFASVELPRWLVANFLLLELAAVVWAVMGTAALHNAQAAFLALFFILPAAVNSEAAHILPGAILLLPPLTGKTILEMRGQIEATQAVAFLLHGVIAVVFVRAAARKYVRGDVIALTPLMGLCLPAVWSIASVVAMRQWPDVRPSAFRWRVPDVNGASVLFTMAGGMFLALAPLTAAVRPQPSGTLRLGRWVPAAAGVVAAVVALTLLPAALARVAPADMTRTRALVYSGIAIGCLAASLCLLARALYVHGWRAWFAIVLWLILACWGPIAYDAARHALSGETTAFAPGVISQVSPLGAGHAIWINGEEPALASIVAQSGFVLIAGMILAGSYAIYRLRIARSTAQVNAILERHDLPPLSAG